MILDSLHGIETLLVRSNGLLSRLGIGSYTSAINQRFAWDYYDTEDSDDAARDLLRPYFVLQEAEIEYRTINQDEMYGVMAVDVTYSENASYRDDHKLSKAHFLDFVGDMLDDCAARQSQPIAGNTEETYITVARIQVLQPAIRSRKKDRDSDRDGSDYWWTKFRFVIGEPGE
jgi:hypothetical protein